MDLLGLSDFWNATLPWEDQTINWEFAGGWTTEEVLSNMLDTTTTLQDLNVSVNTLQGLNPGGLGLTRTPDTTSTLQGIA